MISRASWFFAALWLVPAALSAQEGRFGASVAVADVDGDGFADVVVGEPNFQGTYPEEGRVLVFRGSAAGPASTPSWTRQGNQSRAHFGAHVAAVGDLNTDGFDDVAVCAPDYDVGRARVRRLLGASPLRDAGLLVVYLGSPAGLQTTPALFRPGIQANEHFGASISAAGDVDGDGFDDLIVGGTGANGNRGVALLFTGAPGGVDAVSPWIEFGPSAGARFGSAVGGGGDVNGDGFDDVLVGAPGAGSGISYLYRGSAAGLPATASWSESPAPGDDADNGVSDWGAHLCIAGDLNGDGRDDILIANPTYDANLGHGSGVSPDSGVVFFYRGMAGGDPSFVRRRSGLNGLASAAAGDLDSDGLADVVTGRSSFEDASLLYGDTGFFLNRDSFMIGSHWSAGDVDGDGFDDLVCGSPGFEQVDVLAGSATFLGVTSWVLTPP